MDNKNLESIKAYLRIDGDDENEELQEIQAAAIDYLQRTTRKKYDLNDALQLQAIKLLAAHWYTNRSIESKQAQTAEYSHTLTAILNHIALCDDYVKYEPGA